VAPPWLVPDVGVAGGEVGDGLPVGDELAVGELDGVCVVPAGDGEVVAGAGL
jgi:hypothetical protein